MSNCTRESNVIMWVSCPVRARGRPARFIFGRRKRGDQLFTGFSQLTTLIIINQHLVNFCVNCKIMSKFDKCLDFLKFEENDLSMCCMFGFTRCARYFCAAITACTETAIRALIGKRESGRHL